MKNRIVLDDSVLTDADVRKAAWRYIFWHQCGQNYERMQGLAFGHVLAKPLAKLYKNNKKEYIDSLVRHVQYYNSNPNIGALVPGITLALEEARAKGEPVTTDLIVNTKNSLMGPLAGIGDPLISSVYCSIVASLCISLSVATGSLFGPALYLLLSTGVLVGIKYFCFVTGYKMGIRVVKLLTAELTNTVTLALSVVGVITIGGITSSIVKMPIAFEYVTGETAIVVQDMLDTIMPGILPFAMTILVWFLYAKRNWSTVKALLLVCVISFLFVITGIM